MSEGRMNENRLRSLQQLIVLETIHRHTFMKMRRLATERLKQRSLRGVSDSPTHHFGIQFSLRFFTRRNATSFPGLPLKKQWKVQSLDKHHFHKCHSFSFLDLHTPHQQTKNLRRINK